MIGTPIGGLLARDLRDHGAVLVRVRRFGAARRRSCGASSTTSPTPRRRRSRCQPGGDHLAGDDPSCRPRGGRHARRAFAEAASGGVTKPNTLRLDERGEVNAGRPDAHFEGRPPVVEGAELEFHGQHRRFDRSQPCADEQVVELAFARAGARRFVHEIGIQLPGRRPELA